MTMSCNFCSEELWLFQPSERLSFFNLNQTLTMCCWFCSERHSVLCRSEMFSRLVFVKCLRVVGMNSWYHRLFLRSCLCSEELVLFQPSERLSFFNLNQTLTMCYWVFFLIGVCCLVFKVLTLVPEVCSLCLVVLRRAWVVLTFKCCCYCSVRLLLLSHSETLSWLVFLKFLRSIDLDSSSVRSHLRSCLCSEELWLFQPSEQLSSFILNQTLTMCCWSCSKKVFCCLNVLRMIKVSFSIELLRVVSIVIILLLEFYAPKSICFLISEVLFDLFWFWLNSYKIFVAFIFLKDFLRHWSLSCFSIFYIR